MSPLGRFVSEPIRLTLGSTGLRFRRADIEFYGVDQSGPSFEARVFLNNPGATLDTPPTPESGYAGSFYVYGYGIWPADVGTHERTPSDRYAVRAPIKKVLIATEAVRVAATQGREVIVTVVPVYPGRVTTDASDAFRFEPDNLPEPQRVDAVLALTSFIDFSSQLVHDAIHGWTGGLNPTPPPRGGDMGAVATSAFDPIFWSHHCMIDRLWYLWQLQHGVSNIPLDYLDKPLAPFALTVQDVLDINRLGYEYAQSTISARVPAGSE